MRAAQHATAPAGRGLQPRGRPCSARVAVASPRPQLGGEPLGGGESSEHNGLPARCRNPRDARRCVHSRLARWRLGRRRSPWRANAREHADLDIILDATDVPRLKEALLAIGFRVKPGGTAANFILADEHEREVDVHPIELDQRGYGFFQLADGRRWPFPPAAFAGKGWVGERQVRCLSADAQVQCHAQGYEPTEDDLRDMERLQERFGVVLPISLCRQQSAQ